MKVMSVWPGGEVELPEYDLPGEGPVVTLVGPPPGSGQGVRQGGVITSGPKKPLPAWLEKYLETCRATGKL